MSWGVNVHSGELLNDTQSMAETKLVRGQFRLQGYLITRLSLSSNDIIRERNIGSHLDTHSIDYGHYLSSFRTPVL